MRTLKIIFEFKIKYGLEVSVINLNIRPIINIYTITYCISDAIYRFGFLEQGNKSALARYVRYLKIFC